MSIQSSGIKTYSTVMTDFAKAQKEFKERAESVSSSSTSMENSFAATLNDSLKQVNDIQGAKTQMINAFASGETQNVHELMVTLQKAGLAVNLTSAVRNKVLEAYKELSRIQF